MDQQQGQIGRRNSADPSRLREACRAQQRELFLCLMPERPDALVIEVVGNAFGRKPLLPLDLNRLTFNIGSILHIVFYLTGNFLGDALKRRVFSCHVGPRGAGTAKRFFQRRPILPLGG